MVAVGMLLSDVPSSVPPAQQFDDVRRIVAAAQRAGMSYIAIGQHFLYGDLRWLQPVPLLARLAAECDRETRLATQIMIAPLYHPVLLAEELATLDVVTEGRLVFGAGIGYRPEEFEYLGVPFKERAARTDEILELLVKLWTQDEVTHHGRFWQLEGVTPHLRPVQDPHPPIWVGAQSVAGARRAGRFGDAFPVTPEATYDEIEERFAAVREGFAARGKPFGPQPVRRNVLVADSRDAALVEYARVSKGKYLSYASKGMAHAGDAETLDRDFLTAVAQHAVVGTDAEVVAQLTDLCTRFPVDPLLLRPQWPSMSADETIAAIERLGREVVPAIRALPTPQPEPVPAGMA
ncbi:Flavin-dependent oxidoreductase, luciferase family (includes alkanesulfonate monooxygenase SsuD and methylene tetrahydromethanopterin reductase) [Geodermatophilus dictyosporus]|uniref:Flavin-dependent oxidoreductase, luciferase family (Includes alkanesulfonate monooxygenase SsuD and methylene tetrahydromethanopterin reductase) n=1 Tax=Geodermatophilus dictyosporus TaxID=1523247 RepID=A0A1I5QUY2_9ACTN|nr:LLM class flavin-dependent oxidoreductase [Geodermatophilus dictyosporus]SFP50094.1 Flavin-dependent oxidoreductase, luciferase family (includes alkanesulfonate monooxygenase SsuD and methylene tetrahydromethanopterin reductase) [Geodermatophilus dictyosporus]